MRRGGLGRFRSTLPTLIMQLPNHFSGIKTWIIAVVLLDLATLVFIIQYWKAACIDFIVLIHVC